MGKKNIDAIILPHLISLHVNTPCREEQYDDIHFLLFTFHPIFLLQVYLYIRNYIQLGFSKSSDLLGEKQVLLHDVATPYVEPMLAAVLRQAEAEFDVEASQRER